MHCIILRKTKVKEESLLLDVLTDQDEIQTVKIPGILKSKKRHGFYYFPGNLWNFTFTNLSQGVLYPKESELIFAPLNETASYEDLEQLAILIKVFKHHLKGIYTEGLFTAISIVLHEFKIGDSFDREILLNHFILLYLELLGLLFLDDACTLCGQELDKNDFYVLQEGAICKNCIGLKSEYSSTTVNYGWVSFFLRHVSSLLYRSKSRAKESISKRDDTYNYKKIFESKEFKKSEENRAMLFGYLRQY